MRPTVRFMLAHPAPFIAMGFGAGLSPLAPGTAGTLRAWVSFLALQQWLSSAQIGWLIAASIPVGWWGCTFTARDMRGLDPSSVIWNEIAAFWLVTALSRFFT